MRKTISEMICEACGVNIDTVMSLRYEHQGDNPPTVTFTTIQETLAGPPGQAVERYTLTPIEG